MPKPQATGTRCPRMKMPLGMYAGDEYYIQYNKELGDPWRNPDLYIKLALSA